MQYHAKVELAGKAQFFWNLPQSEMVADLLVPFINGQVRLVKRGGQKRILNMKSVHVITVYRTPDEIAPPVGKKIPAEFKSSGFADCECTEDILNEVQLLAASESAKSMLERAFAPRQQQVFVIMKFGDATLDSAYEGVIEPVINECGLTALRIDKVQDAGRITDQVLDALSSSRFVYADLTGERPNCYYECGFAHALGKEMILTIHDTDRIHFDMAGYRFITWKTEADLRSQLRTRFSALIGRVEDASEQAVALGPRVARFCEIAGASSA